MRHESGRGCALLELCVSSNSLALTAENMGFWCQGIDPMSYELRPAAVDISEKVSLKVRDVCGLFAVCRWVSRVPGLW